MKNTKSKSEPSAKDLINPRKQYNTNEVAKLLGVSPNSARRYFREGRIGRVVEQRGQKVFVASGSDVLKLIAEGDKRVAKEARVPRVLGQSCSSLRIPKAEKQNHKRGKRYYCTRFDAVVQVLEWKKTKRGWMAEVCPVGERGRISPTLVHVSELLKKKPVPIAAV